VSVKPTGLDWSAVTAQYVARGGEPQPEVWETEAKAKRKQPYVPRTRQRPDRIPTGEPRGPAQGFTDAQQKQIVAEYNDNASTINLARKYGVVPSTIRKMILRQGGELRSRSDAMKLSQAERHR
jgi:hypothetical protein